MEAYQKAMKLQERARRELPVIVFVNVPYIRGNQQQRTTRVVELLDHLRQYGTEHNVDNAGEFSQEKAFDALLRFRTSEEAQDYVYQAQQKFPDYEFRT